MEPEAFELLDCFVSSGGNFIDTANAYCRWLPGVGNCSEQMIGRWLKRSGKKDDVIIATKGGHYDFGKPDVSRVNWKEVRRDMIESLKTLGLDHIDFYWLHRDDEAKDIREIIDMMEEFRREGLIRYYGASNYKKYRMEEAVKYARETGIAGFSALSNEHSAAVPNPEAVAGADPSLVRIDEDYLKWLRNSKLTLIPYSAQAQGYFSKKAANTLTEKMIRKYANARNDKAYEAIREIAERRGISIARASLELLKKEAFQVIPIISASSVVQLQELM